MNERINARDGINLPVQVNGRSLSFQLDTGADIDVIYGAIAERDGWARSTDHSFRPATLKLGATVIRRPHVRISRGLDGENVQGTLGLADLVGRVVVIDYAGERFCLFNRSQAPAVVLALAHVPAALRNGKVFLAAEVGEFHSDSLIFDTGSSQFPLIVDLSAWRALTSLSDPMSAPITIDASSWGQTVHYSGATADHAMRIGWLTLTAPTVFTAPAAPNGFAQVPFKVDGIIGNAIFEHGLVVLDLTEHISFGYAP